MNSLTRFQITKKIVEQTFLSVLIILSIFSCSANNIIVRSDMIAYVNQGTLAEVSVNNILWQVGEKNVVKKNGKNITTIQSPSGIISINIEVSNKTDNAVFIDWEKSCVFYDNKSYVPVLEVTKYFEAGSPPAITVIPGSMKIKTLVFSSGQIGVKQSLSLSSGQLSMAQDWTVNPITSKITYLYLCIVSSEKEEYYQVKINPYAEKVNKKEEIKINNYEVNKINKIKETIQKTNSSTN